LFATLLKLAEEREGRRRDRERERERVMEGGIVRDV